VQVLSLSQQEPSSAQLALCEDFAETLKTTIAAAKIRAAIPAISHLYFFIGILPPKLKSKKNLTR